MNKMLANIDVYSVALYLTISYNNMIEGKKEEEKSKSQVLNFIID